MEDYISVAAFVLSLFSAFFSLYTFVWTKKGTESRQHWKRITDFKNKCWII